MAALPSMGTLTGPDAQEPPGLVLDGARQEVPVVSHSMGWLQSDQSAQLGTGSLMGQGWLLAVFSACKPIAVPHDLPLLGGLNLCLVLGF